MNTTFFLLDLEYIILVESRAKLSNLIIFDNQIKKKDMSSLKDTFFSLGRFYLVASLFHSQPDNPQIFS